MNILEAIDDPQLFGRRFRTPETWKPWRVFLKALFALPMDDDERVLFTQCSGRGEPPDGMVREAALICGRRSGKSVTLAMIGVYLGCFKDWTPWLQPGEVGTIAIIASDRRQARTIMRYMRSLLMDTPMLAQMVEAETAERIDLNNNVVIEVHTCSYRSVHGYSIVAALCDETAFWHAEDSAEPDDLVIDSLLPAMATIPDAMLLIASSPWAKRGALYEFYRRHYGKEKDPALCWRAPTRVMNPTVPQHIIDRAMERDPQKASADYMAEFRADIESYISKEVIDSVTSLGVFERAPSRAFRYFGFTDPSGGSGDSMATCVTHLENGRAVLDAIRETVAPFNPEIATEDHARLLKSYRITTVEGDRYAGKWPQEVWARHGISYRIAKRAKTGIYVDALPRLNAGEVDLLDVTRLRHQLTGLERSTARGTGKETIDHAPGAKDDVANAALGALLAAFEGKKRTYSIAVGCCYGPGTLLDPPERARDTIRLVTIPEREAKIRW